MQELEPEVENIKKTRRDKRETVCISKRYSHEGCGICGSLNKVEQGVIYCEKCGEEVEVIDDRSAFRYRKDRNEDLPQCNCTVEVKMGKKYHKYKPTRYLVVHKCTDCGAVQGQFCPNCSKNSPLSGSKLCWQHWDGRLFCQHCGYKRDEKTWLKK
jgi:hypothetical protein